MYVTMINELNVGGNPAKMTTASAIPKISSIMKDKPVRKDPVFDNNQEVRSLAIFLCVLASVFFLVYLGKKIYHFVKAIRGIRADQERIQRALAGNVGCYAPRVRYSLSDSVVIPVDFNFGRSDTSTNVSYNGSGATLDDVSFDSEMCDKPEPKKMRKMLQRQEEKLSTFFRKSDSDISTNVLYGGSGSTFNEAIYDSELDGFIGPKNNPKILQRQEEIWSQFFRKPEEPGWDSSKLMEWGSSSKEAANKDDNFQSPMSKKVSRFIVTPVIEDRTGLDIDKNPSISASTWDSESQTLTLVHTEVVQFDGKADLVEISDLLSNISDILDAQQNSDAKVQSRLVAKSVIRADSFDICQKTDGNTKAQLKPRLSIITEIEESRPLPVVEEESQPPLVVEEESQPPLAVEEESQPPLVAEEESQPPPVAEEESQPQPIV